MKSFKKSIFLIILFVFFSSLSFAQQINVCIKIRGNTGLEGRVKEVLSKEFASREMVRITEEREESHLYLDLSLTEQEPIRFYGLGISIAYHLKGHFYSRPTSDVAQFGEERLEDVCKYLAKEIDKAFIGPLRKPAE